MKLEEKIKDVFFGIKYELNKKMGLNSFDMHDVLFRGNYPTVHVMESSDKPQNENYKIIGYLMGKKRGIIEVHIKDMRLDEAIAKYLKKHNLQYEVKEFPGQKYYNIKVI